MTSQISLRNVVLFFVALLALTGAAQAQVGQSVPPEFPPYFVGTFSEIYPKTEGGSVPELKVSVNCSASGLCELKYGENKQYTYRNTSFELVKELRYATLALSYAREHRNVAADSPYAWKAQHLQPLLVSTTAIESCVDIKSQNGDHEYTLLCKLVKDPWAKNTVLLMTTNMGTCDSFSCRYDIFPLFREPPSALTSRNSKIDSALIGRLKKCPDCAEMVKIPAGSFEMDQQKDRPGHVVNIKGFALGKTHVTQGQWQAVMGSNPSSFTECGDDCPVETVSWNDVQAFIRKLNQMTGKPFRLPSEAEWEYACRAGGHHTYCGSDNVDAVGWYGKYGGPGGNSGKKTHPVAQKQANAFGLYDMSGNVYQMAEDYYHETYDGAPNDGSAWITGGEQKERVLRGGAWYIDAEFLGATRRGRIVPDKRGANVIGFRLAMTLSAP